MTNECTDYFYADLDAVLLQQQKELSAPQDRSLRKKSLILASVLFAGGAFYSLGGLSAASSVLLTSLSPPVISNVEIPTPPSKTDFGEFGRVPVRKQVRTPRDVGLGNTFREIMEKIVTPTNGESTGSGTWTPPEWVQNILKDCVSEPDHAVDVECVMVRLAEHFGHLKGDLPQDIEFLRGGIDGLKVVIDEALHDFQASMLTKFVVCASIRF